MNEKLILPRNLVQQLFHHAQSSPEDEVCGLISQTTKGELQLHKIPNVADQPSRRFSMHEAQLVKTLQAIREARARLFAIYHSHPTAPAEPSAQDLAESGYPEAWQLIISLNTKGVLELRAWRFEDGVVAETPLKIIDD